MPANSGTMVHEHTASSEPAAAAAGYDTCPGALRPSQHDVFDLTRRSDCLGFLLLLEFYDRLLETHNLAHRAQGDRRSRAVEQQMEALLAAQRTRKALHPRLR